MKALTVWQPWASLIIIGAKPYEFRKWDYRARAHELVDQRIALHAGARPIKLAEVLEILDRVAEGESALVPDLALPVLQRLRDGHKAQLNSVLPLSSVLGTAILREPVRAYDLYKDKVADSSRIDQHIWAWPLTGIERFDEPVPYRGAQGFWNFPDGLLP